MSILHSVRAERDYVASYNFSVPSQYLCLFPSSNLIQVAVPAAPHALVSLSTIELVPFSILKDVVILLGHSQLLQWSHLYCLT